MAASLAEMGTIARTTKSPGATGVDPRRRRFGYNPGVLWMEVDPQHSGRQQRLLPAGRLIPFESAELRVENFDINSNAWTPQKTEEFKAAWFIGNAKTRYAEDGFVEVSCLTHLDDPKVDGRGLEVEPSVPRAYFEAVHPAFNSVGLECPFDAERTAEQKGTCVTCRLALLGNEEKPSERLRTYIEASGLDPELCESLRLELLASNTTLAEKYTIRWAEITGELDERHAGRDGLPTLKTGEHHIRRHLHQPTPAQIPAMAANAHAEATAETINAGFDRIAESNERLAAAILARPADNSSAEFLQIYREQQEEMRAMRDEMRALREPKNPPDAPAETNGKKEKVR